MICASTICCNSPMFSTPSRCLRGCMWLCETVLRTLNYCKCWHQHANISVLVLHVIVLIFATICTRRKVRDSTKWSQYIFTGTLTSLQDLMAVHSLVVETPRTTISVHLMLVLEKKSGVHQLHWIHKFCVNLCSKCKYILLGKWNLLAFLVPLVKKTGVTRLHLSN